MIVFTLFKSLTSLTPYAVSSYSHMHYYERELDISKAGNEKEFEHMDEQEKTRRLLS